MKLKLWTVLAALIALGMVGCSGDPPAESTGTTGSTGSASTSTSASSSSTTSSTSTTSSSSGTSGSGSTTSATNGSGSSTGTPTTGTSGTNGFQPGDHEPLPQVPDNGGGLGVLDHVQMITITDDRDTRRSGWEALDHWIVGSDWYAAVGADYGVGLGTHFQDVHVSDLPAPAAGATSVTTSDDDIQAYLKAKIAGGVFPAPSTTLTKPLYVLFYPSDVTIDLGGGDLSCQAFGGYHSWIDLGSGGGHLRVPYAVLPFCNTGHGIQDLVETQIALSHELIEAATDPIPTLSFQGPGTSTYGIEDQNQPWSFVPGEVGDLCVGSFMSATDPVSHTTFYVQRIWSNAAAALGEDPCIPEQVNPYYNVSTTPSTLTMVAPGASASFTLKGWSTAAMPELSDGQGPGDQWYLAVQPYMGTFNATAAITGAHSSHSGYQMLGNGGSATLTVSVPANVVGCGYSVVWIYSIDSFNSQDFSYWPVAVATPACFGL